MEKTFEELLEFGILNIDKSSGPTSFQISDFVRKKLGLRKTSHFGTLDPKVTGVLPIALNRACKLTGYFLGHDKEYVGIMNIHEDVPIEEVEKKIKEKFFGKITQLPPVKSRVKRQEREREIISFDILEKNGKDFLFQVVCEAGTYIRKLVHDLGEELGCGAHMLELRRTRAGIFTEENSINLNDFEKLLENKKELAEKIIPGEIIKEIFPSVEVKEEAVERIFHGSPVHKDELVKEEKINSSKLNANPRSDLHKDETICVFAKERFIGIFKVINEKNIFAKSEFTLQPIK